MHFCDIYPAEGIIKSKENTGYWMDSPNPPNKNNFFRALPSDHLKCWKVNVYRDKRQVPFLIKMTCEHCLRGMCTLKKPAFNNTPVFSSASIIFSSNWKEHLLQQEAQAFSEVQKCISEICPCLTFIKLQGPRHWQMRFITFKARHICCDNLLHLKNGICIWGGRENQDSYLVFWFLLH